MDRLDYHVKRRLNVSDLEKVEITWSVVIVVTRDRSYV